MSGASAGKRPVSWQPLILEPVPAVGRFLVFDLDVGSDPRGALVRLREEPCLDRAVIGVGKPLVLAVGAKIPGLRPFPAISGPGIAFPSTQGALWAFVAATEQGELHDHARALCASLGESFRLREEVHVFQYRGGRDLSGYEDGTENPKGEAAVAAAFVSGRGPGLDGGSFVAVQRYVHALDRFSNLTTDARDHTMGRNLASNEEIAGAPTSAHVKRAAQETFDPPAFMLRRSMPWGGVSEHGLYFVAYGESLDRYERVLTRMAGLEDGTVDGLMSFTRAVSGGYYWCPPVRDGRIDWSALAL